MATGIGVGDSGRVAAREAVEQATAQFGDAAADLVILYCSSNYEYQEVLDTVREQTGESQLIGASTAGEFTEKDVRLGSVAVALIKSDDIRFFTGLAEHVDRDTETAVAKITTQVPVPVPGLPHRCLFLLTDGMAGNGEEIALMVANMSGPATRIIGGLAADDFKMQRTVVFHNDRVVEKAASFCVMDSKKRFYSSVNHGHRPLSEPMRVTRAEGHILHTIGGVPAWEVWKEKTVEQARELGFDVHSIRDTGDIAVYFSNFELGLRTGTDSYKVRYPMSKNEDGSINFTCAIPDGAMVYIMDGRDSVRQVAASRIAAEHVRQVAEADGYARFGGALVVECAVRKVLLGKRFHEAPESISKVLGGIPMIGAEAYGEIHLAPGDFSGYHNTSTVVLLLPE